MQKKGGIMLKICWDPRSHSVGRGLFPFLVWQQRTSVRSYVCPSTCNNCWTTDSIFMKLYRPICECYCNLWTYHFKKIFPGTSQRHVCLSALKSNTIRKILMGVKIFWKKKIHTEMTHAVHVMKPTWRTIYLQFIPSLYLYMLRAC
jgi:hypothetical protein